MVIRIPIKHGLCPLLPSPKYHLSNHSIVYIGIINRHNEVEKCMYNIHLLFEMPHY